MFSGAYSQVDGHGVALKIDFFKKIDLLILIKKTVWGEVYSNFFERNAGGAMAGDLLGAKGIASSTPVHKGKGNWERCNLNTLPNIGFPSRLHYSV